MMPHASSSQTTLDDGVVEVSTAREDEPLLSSNTRRLHGHGVRSYSSTDGSTLAIEVATDLDDEQARGETLEDVWKDVEEGHGHGHGKSDIRVSR